jgi:DNA-binding GntR family transcriptional regulator
MRRRTLVPVYRQIAMDVASKIANGYYLEGQKLYARSSLASQYNVSAETARRAISILSNMRIVDTAKGSGVIVLSCKIA